MIRHILDITVSKATENTSISHVKRLFCSGDLSVFLSPSIYSDLHSIEMNDYFVQ